jgi:hypothetical protein
MDLLCQAPAGTLIGLGTVKQPNVRFPPIADIRSMSAFDAKETVRASLVVRWRNVRVVSLYSDAPRAVRLLPPH